MLRRNFRLDSDCRLCLGHWRQVLLAMQGTNSGQMLPRLCCIVTGKEAKPWVCKPLAGDHKPL